MRLYYLQHHIHDHEHVLKHHPNHEHKMLSLYNKTELGHPSVSALSVSFPDNSSVCPDVTLASISSTSTGPN